MSQARAREVRIEVVDASGQILGRVASKVAKLLLTGTRVHLVNAEKALISGSRRSVIEERKQRLTISSVVHPRHGPLHPRTAEGIVKRTVRGMLPYRKSSGREALKRLRVHAGVPEELRGREMTTFRDTKITRPVPYYVPVGEIASAIGQKGGS